MTILRISGGLGNQLNYYFYGKFLEKKFKRDVLFDFSLVDNDWQCMNYLGYFGLSYKTTNGVDTRGYINLDDCKSKDDVLNDRSKNLIVHSMYRHPFYFIEKTTEFLNDITFRTDVIRDKDYEILKRITESDSICIHLRRGDYYKVKQTRDIFGVLGSKYYSKAIDIIKQKISKPMFFVFSDEPDEAVSLLDLDTSFTVVRHNISRTYNFLDNYTVFRKLKYLMKVMNPGRLEKAYNDFFLMSNCKHHIIANSTFSWWSAYLSKNSSKTVIAPLIWSSKRTSADTVPSEWIKI